MPLFAAVAVVVVTAAVGAVLPAVVGVARFLFLTGFFDDEAAGF